MPCEGNHQSPDVRLEYLEWLTRAQAGEIQGNLRYIATLKEKIERLEEAFVERGKRLELLREML